MNFRAVVFDLDGTLLNTIEDITDSTNKVLSRFGFPTYSEKKYKIFVGEGAVALLRKVLPKDHQDEPTLKACMALLIFEELRKRKKSKTRPYEGVAELLSELVQRKIKLAILSNRPSDSTNMLVKRHLLEWPFKLVVGAGSKFPNKPDPTAALDIAKKLRVVPEKVLYLGDSDVDMKTAVAAGMYPAGALWGFRSAAELKKFGAKALIKKPRDLLKYFL